MADLPPAPDERAPGPAAPAASSRRRGTVYIFLALLTAGCFLSFLAGLSQTAKDPHPVQYLIDHYPCQPAVQVAGQFDPSDPAHVAELERVEALAKASVIDPKTLTKGGVLAIGGWRCPEGEVP